ncbi:MAG: DNA repair protein RecN [Myxococcota bacterium]|nr:DNA repair protein RecN [Myxococcota bacterium]MDW8362090.1 DNA repair protein RecN [Myxococcales bacterium]
MLTRLRIRNLAVIDEVDVGFGPGLTVVTGETGAGKSMLVDALELVLGARARPDVVRAGCEEAEVEALFDVSGLPALRARLAAEGIADEEDDWLVRRIVGVAGRSRAYVNGRLATAGQLARLTAGLVDICSQHEYHGLVEPGSHLRILDAFGRFESQRERMAQAHAALQRAVAAEREITEFQSRRDERIELLRHRVAEIDAVAPRVGEVESLEAERERLRHAERIARAALRAASELLEDDGSIGARLAALRAELQGAAAFDARLRPHVDAIESARLDLEEAARELGRIGRDVRTDPEALGAVEERLDALRRLLRKHGGSVDAVLQARAAAAQELENLERVEEHRARLAREREEAMAAAAEIARALRAERRRAADRLAEAIGDELRSLGMGEAQVLVEVSPATGHGPDEIAVDGARLGPSGIDRVELLIAPNRGEPPRPLRRIASGGELSRAMLAIRRVLAGLEPAGVYVFDEVDAGVGGAVAETIGRKLADIAAHHQVICITHLPQIAAFGHAHLRVRKSVRGERTHSVVEPLDATGRLEEIARMLGGTTITARTRAAAAELLERAAAGSGPGATGERASSRARMRRAGQASKGS